MKAETILSFVGSGILGGGVVSSIVAYRKLKPESDQIIVSSAKDVILIQKGAMDDLRQQMADLETRFSDRLDRAEQARWTAETALAECHRARQTLMVELEEERTANAELTARVEALEAEVAELREINRRRPQEDP